MRDAHKSHASGGHLPRMSTHSVMPWCPKVIVGPAPAPEPEQRMNEAMARMSDKVLDVHRRALVDYRIALGLELRSRRTNAEYSFEDLASRSNIPAETLRSYEKGASLPQLTRLANIGNVYDVTIFDILEATAEYIYRAHGELATNRFVTSVNRTTLDAVVLYCGVTPAQLHMMNIHPHHRETLSDGLFRK